MILQGLQNNMKYSNSSERQSNSKWFVTLLPFVYSSLYSNLEKLV